jgi:hypothetical protein
MVSFGNKMKIRDKYFRIVKKGISYYGKILDITANVYLVCRLYRYNYELKRMEETHLTILHLNHLINCKMYETLSELERHI